MRLPPELIDRELGAASRICIDCGETFQPDAGRRDRSLPPVQRCAGCRARRLAERNAANLAAHRGQLPRASRHAPPVEPESAARRTWEGQCSDCGRQVRLAFRPRADRPTFCRMCWEARNGQ